MAKVLILNGSPHEHGCTATALEEMIYDLTDDEIDDALHDAIDPRDLDRDVYFDEVDEIMERAYNSWDGSRIDEEPDMDNTAYEDDDESSDMDSFSWDEGRLDEDWF